MWFQLLHAQIDRARRNPARLRPPILPSSPLPFPLTDAACLSQTRIQRATTGAGSPPPPGRICRGALRECLCTALALTLTGTGHFASFHGTRGVGTTPPCRFAPDWARASRKKKRACRSPRDEEIDIPDGPEKNVPNFAQVLSRSLSGYEGDIWQVFYAYNLGHVW